MQAKEKNPAYYRELFDSHVRVGLRNHEIPPMPATGLPLALHETEFHSRPANRLQRRIAGPCWKSAGNSGCVAASTQPFLPLADLESAMKSHLHNLAEIIPPLPCARVPAPRDPPRASEVAPNGRDAQNRLPRHT